MRVLLTLLLVACVAPTDSLEVGKCRFYENVVSDLAVRCGGHRLSPDVLRCDRVILSNKSSEELSACQAWAVSVDCDEYIEFGFPDVCKAEFRHAL